MLLVLESPDNNCPVRSIYLQTGQESTFVNQKANNYLNK